MLLKTLPKGCTECKRYSRVACDFHTQKVHYILRRHDDSFPRCITRKLTNLLYSDNNNDINIRYMVLPSLHARIVWIINHLVKIFEQFVVLTLVAANGFQNLPTIVYYTISSL